MQLVQPVPALEVIREMQKSSEREPSTTPESKLAGTAALANGGGVPANLSLPAQDKGLL